MSSLERAPSGGRETFQTRAQALAREMVVAVERGDLHDIGPEAVQDLAAAVCRAYAAHQEAGAAFPILARREAATGTDVMIACSALLKAADLQIFELGMWSSWTGR